MWLALPTSIVSILVAFPIAYAFRGQSRYEGRWILSLVAPIAAGPVVIADGLLTLLGPRGWVSRGLRVLHVVREPLYWTHHYTGVAIAVVASGFPLVILVMRSYFLSVDESLLQAAATLGAGRWKRFCHVSLPMCWRGVVVAFCLSFVHAFSTFPAAVILGAPTGPTRVLSRVAYEAAYERSDYPMAGCIATIMAVAQLLVVVAVMGIARLASGASEQGLADAGIVSNHSVSRRRPGLVASMIMVLGLGSIGLAVAAAAVNSFAKEWRNSWLPRAWTLGWYPTAWTDFQLKSVLGVTGEVVATVTLMAMAMGVPSAFILARSRWRWKRATLWIVLLPLLLPPMTYGIPLATLMYRVGLTGTFWGVVLANLVPAIPLAILVLTPLVEAIDPNIESAARVFGARPHQVVWHVHAPLLASGVFAAALLVAVRTLGNFELTFLVAGSESKTLVVAVYDAISATGLRAPQSVDAVAMIYVVIIVALVAMAMGLVPSDGLVAGVATRRDAEGARGQMPPAGRV